MPRLKPKPTADMLGISTSALRTWAQMYGPDFLSPYANTARRQYTDRDIAILRKIQDLLGQGNTHEQIQGILTVQVDDIPDEVDDVPQQQPQPGQGETTAVSLQPFVLLAQSQMKSLDDVLERLRQIERELNALRVEVARIKGAAHDHPGIVPKRPANLD